jgi:hypothetical protein
MISTYATQTMFSRVARVVAADARRETSPAPEAAAPQTIVDSALAAERARIRAILASPAAKGREQQARALALSSDLSADQAAVRLGAAPSDEEVLAASIVSLVQPVRPDGGAIAVRLDKAPTVRDAVAASAPASLPAASREEIELAASIVALVTAQGRS